ncbi:MAG: A24 family peptidase [Coriobacteriia bacterium]|nr:A24 family peptidase [Coriobacteriia bacterium]
MLFLVPLIGVLVTIAIVDARTHTIPDMLWIVVALLGIARVIAGQLTWQDAVLGAFIVSVPLFAIAYFTDGFGGGDIKLMFAAGIYLGATIVVLAFALGTVLAAFVGIVLLLARRTTRKSAIAFGPYLAIGIAVMATLDTFALIL